MVKNVLLQQRAEKEDLLKNDFVVRDQTATAQSLLPSSLIKVVLGPRRAGKSFFCHQLLQSKNYAYANFDDETLTKTPIDEILAALFEIYSRPEFIFLDEIQNLPGWEFVINKLHRRGFNLFVTGSNARLLSRELATALTGRHAPIEILPFSFAEYLQARNLKFNESIRALPETKGQLQQALDDYLVNGGFPEIVLGKVNAAAYLNFLFQSSIFVDVVKRHNVRFSKLISDLANWFCANFSNTYSYQKLKTVMNFSSAATVEKYVSYLEEAYLIFSLSRFSFKAGERLKSPRKCYLPDTGLAASQYHFSLNTGKLLENAVFLELKRRGFQPGVSLFYYKDANGHEVDFVIDKTGNKQLIQVTLELTGENRERELKSLISTAAAINSRDLLVVTLNQEENIKYKNEQVRVISFSSWSSKEFVSQK